MAHDIIILGSGPAGITAAIYLARDGFSTMLIEGDLPGGQLTTTTEVENFPGFPGGIMGPELMQAMREQAKRFGAEIVAGMVTALTAQEQPFTVTVNGENVYEARSIIIATGSSPRRLNIPSEKELWGKGVSSCATCDGFFYRDKEIVVIGGGDSALEEALFLSRFGTSVKVIHRRDQLRASSAMQEKVKANKKISFVWDSVVNEITSDADGVVNGIIVKNVKTEECTVLSCQGVFLAIGHTPNTAFLPEVIKRDDQGYILTTQGMQTSCDGIFVCGDVADPHYKQAITAAGSGCKAALDVERYLQ